MNTALHISYADFLLMHAADRGRIDGTTGTQNFTTGEKVSLGIWFTDAMKQAWEKCKGKDWVWPFLVQSATLTVTSGAIALTSVDYAAWVSLWSADPRPATTTGYRIPIRVADSSGIYPHDNLTSVFGLYIPRAPEFNSTAWEADTAYDAGTVIYHTTSGNCYRAKIAVTTASIAITNTTYWEEQLIPRDFDSYLSLMVAAAYERSAGRPDEEARLESKADDALSIEFAAAFKGGPSGSGKPWTAGGTWL